MDSEKVLRDVRSSMLQREPMGRRISRRHDARGGNVSSPTSYPLQLIPRPCRRIMPSVHRIWVILVLLGVLFVLSAHAGIPEPGITLYGKVFDLEGCLLTEGTLTWVYSTSAGTGNTVSVATELRQMDAQDDTFSYVVQIPAQVPIGGLPVQADTLSLEETAVVYRRGAVYQQSALAFDVPASVSVSMTDRGAVERVDLFLGRTVAGDIDGDDKVTAVDVQNVINTALGLDVGGRAPLTDLNGDGVVDAIDVQLAVNGALGISIRRPDTPSKADDTTTVSEEQGEGESEAQASTGQNAAPVVEGTPVAGVLGLTSLAAVCAIVGAFGIRRKK